MAAQAPENGVSETTFGDVADADAATSSTETTLKVRKDLFSVVPTEETGTSTPSISSESNSDADPTVDRQPGNHDPDERERIRLPRWRETQRTSRGRANSRSPAFRENSSAGRPFKHFQNSYSRRPKSLRRSRSPYDRRRSRSPYDRSRTRSPRRYRSRSRYRSQSRSPSRRSRSPRYSSRCLMLPSFFLFITSG
jgi:hypothetical protein